MDDFQWRLEKLREKAGYTQQELSLKLGYTKDVYGTYERGERKPSIETMVSLSHLFNQSIDYLATGKEFQQKEGHLLKKKALEELLDIFAKKGIDYPYFLQPKKWSILDYEDIKYLGTHFEWIVHNKNESR